MKNAAPKSQGAVVKPYVPTLADAEAFKAYMAAREKAAPRLKVAPGAPITVDHPNKALGQIALMKAIGSTDDDFVKGLLKQLASAGSQGQKPDEGGINFMLSVVKGIEPRDQIEAMLAAQMAAVHNATMTFARHLAHVDNLPQQDSAKTPSTSSLARSPLKSRHSKITARRANSAWSFSTSTSPRADRRSSATSPRRPRGWGRRKKLEINPMLLDMRQALRCRAKSKRSGKRCRSPAVRGYSVCRLHGAGGGAPKGNRNALKHGASSAETLALRKEGSLQKSELIVR
jgi:hypothetical protein